MDKRWRSFRDHTAGGEYADWSSERDGVARYHSTREGGYHWFEVVYDNPDKNGLEPTYLHECDIEIWDEGRG